MKYLVVIIAGISLCLCQINAQSQQSKGMIKYEVTDVKSESGSYENSMLSGLEYLIYVMDNKIRREISIMDGRVEYIYISSPEYIQDSLYLSAGPNRIKVALSEDVFSSPPINKSDIIEIPDSTTTILDLQCQLVTIDASEANIDKSFKIYLSRNQSIPSYSIVGLNTSSLNGVPMRILTIESNTKVTYTATEFSDNFNSSVFRYNSNGYQSMTMEEFEQNVGGIPGK